MRTGISITLKPSDRRRLKAVTRNRNAPHKYVWRAEIVLFSADGIGTNEIMRRTGKSKTCIWRWQERFMQEGYDGLLRDKTRPSRIPPLGYGTTTLFAALNVLDGTVIGRNMQHHRHQEFIRFLNTIEAQVPARKEIHAIVDNYATHKHPKVRQWLTRHPRWTFHFTPTSASWLNAVEGFFAKLTKQRLKRGIFLSVVDLQAAINRFVVEHNAEPKPFTWTADPDKIIQAVRPGHQVLDSIH
jgi:transposase